MCSKGLAENFPRFFRGFGAVSVIEGFRFAKVSLLKHDADVTDLNHSRAGVGTALVVFAVASTATVPGIATFDDPSLLSESNVWLVGFR